jgi:hypothetical protein
MITLTDAPEMIDDWRAGELRFEDLYARCLDLMELDSVDDVLAPFRRDFDNATPAADYRWFDSGRGDHPAKVIIIERVRAWLRAQVR